MSEQQALIRLIEAKPKDRLRKKILADWMQEYHALPRFAALRFAAKFGRDVVAEFEHKKAEWLLSDRSQFRRFIFGEIQEAIGRSEEDTLTVYLMPGSRPPKASIVLNDFDDDGVLQFHVTVGARWVIRLVEDVRIQPTDAEIREAIRFGKEL